MASIWTSAAQAEQQGFNESYYIGQKAALLTTQTGTTWTVDMVRASFASAGLQAYEHYQQYGFKEGLNPNAYFNNAYYDSSKAAASGSTESAFQTAWNNVNGGSQTSTYFHYLQYGFNEAGVNPSATFSEAQYYVDKAALLTAQTGQTWTVAQVEAAFASAGLTPITHYMLYGGTPNEPTPQPVSGGTGTTYTLTTGMDNIPGTALNDTILAGEVGGAKTLTAGDIIDGAGGTNTIKVSDSAAAGTSYAGFTMQNVQILDVTSDGGGSTLDLSGTTGLTSINSVNSSAAVKADYVATLANVGITNATAAANMTVGYQDVTGASDTVGLTMTNSSAGTIRLGGQGTNTGIETVALHSSGTASTIAGLDSQITNLTFDGSANVKIGGTLDTVKVVDASSATGGLTVTIGTANTKAVTFTGGSGADSITFNAGSLTAADTVKGGDGSDTLVADRDGLFAAGAAGKVTQVETITMSDQLTAASTFKGGTWFADATTFNLDAGYVGGSTALITTGTTTAGQAVRIAENNIGTLTITDTATSATNDQATLGVYKAAGQVANTNVVVAYTTNELETLNLTSGSTTATTASDTTNILNVSGGLGKATTLNISGADNLTLTTAASAINTVAAGTALGDLNLLNVQYAVPAATTAVGATITTGSGVDQVNGTLGKDTINTGAGNDIVTGTQGADSITLGDGNDTVVYTALNQSDSASTDTITDFVSGSGDRLDIASLGTSAPAVGGLNQATFALAVGALAGGIGTVQAVFQQDANTLWVDMDANGQLNAADFRVVLSGVSSLTTDDLGLANVITVVAGINNPGTTGNDIFMATGAVLNTPGTLITGLAGNNSLVVQDALAGNLNLGVGGPTLATDIDVIDLQAGSGGFTLTVQDEANVTVNASAASTVNLGAATGQTFNGSAAVDVLTLGFGSQTARMGASNDTVKSSVANLANSTIDGGTGTADALQLTSLGVADLNGGGGTAATVTGIEKVILSTAGNTLRANINNVGVEFTAGNAGNHVVTNNAANLAVDATNLGAFSLQLSGTAATAITNLGLDTVGAASTIVIDAGVASTSISDKSDNGADDHTITNNSAGTVTITESATAAHDLTLNGSGTGHITVDNVGSDVAQVNIGGTVPVDLTLDNANSTVAANGTGAVTIAAAALADGTVLTLSGSQDIAINGLADGDIAAGAAGTGDYHVTVTNLHAADSSIVLGTGSDTIDFNGTLRAGDVITGGAGTDTLNMTLGGIGSGTVTQIETINLKFTDAPHTLTTGAMAPGAASAITASDSTKSVTLDASAYVVTASLAITDGQVDDSIILHQSDANRLMTSVSLATGGTDTIQVGNADGYDANTDSGMVVSSFITGTGAGYDKLVLSETGVDATSYQALNVKGGAIAALNSVIEFETGSAGTVADLHSIADGGAVETAIANSLTTGIGAGGGEFYAVLYSATGEAGVYEVSTTAAAGAALTTANTTVELLGVVNNVAQNSFVHENFNL